MHVNTQVREEVKARLEEINDLAKIFTNRPGNLIDAHLPAAVVQTSSDTITKESKASKGLPPQEKRLIALGVVLVADGESDTLDDDLDKLRVQVESAVAEDEALGGIAKQVQHTGATLEMGADEDGDRWFAFLAMSWQVEVWTHYGDPEVAR